MLKIAHPAFEEGDGAAGDSAHRWILRVMEAEGPAILRMLWRILGSDADVMDAYQDCFCKLASRGGGKDLASAKAYVYRTASNIAIEMVRSRNRRRVHLPAIAADRSADREDDPRAGVSLEEASGLQEAIPQLPSHLRQVVVLRDLCKMAYEEIGRVLSISPATARVYRRHAVVKLSELLGEESEDD